MQDVSSMNELAEVLSKNRTIGWLVLYNLDITPYQMSKIAQSQSLSGLALTKNHINDATMDALSSNKTINTLAISDENSISNQALFRFLDTHPLEELSFHAYLNFDNEDDKGYQLGNAGLAGLVKHLSKNQLRSLLINDDTITDITPLKALNKLEIISITSAGVEDYRPLKNLHQLQIISLRYGTIEAKDIAAFSSISNLYGLELFTMHPSRTTMNFSKFKNLSYVFVDSYPTSIMDDSALASLAKLPKLESVYTSRQNISDEGAKAIAQNHHLIGLVIKYSRVADKGAAAIAENHHIKYLELSHSKVSDKGAIALTDNSSLRGLDLSYNLIGDAGGMALAHVTNIEDLSLSYNRLTDLTAHELAINGKYDDLYLYGNDFSADAITELKNNPNITWLYIDDNSTLAKMRKFQFTKNLDRYRLSYTTKHAGRQAGCLLILASLKKDMARALPPQQALDIETHSA